MSKLLLEHGADPNVQSLDGTTPLMTASLKKSVDVMKLMISKGANINVQAADGTTALILASIYGQKDQIELLVAAGARIDITDYVSWNLLRAVLGAYFSVLSQVRSECANLCVKLLTSRRDN